MERHHRRRQVCHTRPAYRDGRKEKAVKVYTVNNESRYLLVQGVPALKLTKELLDVCSLYGAIHEYRLLEDFPEKEEFTEVYWIQYQQLQAARVAKRKLDDRPFYGSTLHVCYAPEYETIDDTRQKLQDRRKAVARRIRILDAEQQDAAKESSNPETTETSHSSEQGREEQIARTEDIGSNESSTSSANQSNTGTEPGSTVSLQNPRPDVAADTAQTGTQFPQLPLPPKTLPRSEWTGPDRPSSEFPRLPSAHATLPSGFNPYPEGKPALEDRLPNTSPDVQLHPKEIGPHLPSGSFRTSEGSEPTTSGGFDQEGAKPKIDSQRQQSDADLKRLSRKRQSSDLDKSGNQQSSVPRADSNPGRPVKKRALDRCSVPRTHQPSSSFMQDISTGGIQGGPSNVGFLPRKLQAQQRGLQGNQSLGLGQQGNKGLATGNVRSDDTAPNTGDASLDSTVQDIRNRLRAVTDAGIRAFNPTNVPSASPPDVARAQQAERPAQHRRPRTARRKI